MRRFSKHRKTKLVLGLVSLLAVLPATAKANNAEANYLLQKEWNGGGMSSVIVRNTGSLPITSWSVSWSWPGNQVITSSWNASLNQQGVEVTADCQVGNCEIPVGEAKAFGFNFNVSGENIDPRALQLSINGTNQEPAPAPSEPGDNTTSPPAEPTPSEPPTDDSVVWCSDDQGIQISYQLNNLNENPNGLGTGSASVFVRNHSGQAISNWQSQWRWPEDHQISLIWNAETQAQGQMVEALCQSGHCLIDNGHSRSFGFNFSFSSGYVAPDSLKIAADICSIVVAETPTEPDPNVPDPTPAPTPTPSPVPQQAGDSYNYILGTQTIGPHYSFTNDSRIVETAKAIREMGSNTLKFSLSPFSYADMIQDYQSYTYQFTRLARDVAPFKQVLDMDFTYYMLWLEDSGSWMDNQGMSQQELDLQYNKIYELTEYLLTTYNNSGKTFMFGNWEVDWQLVKTTVTDPVTGHTRDVYDDSVQTVPALRIQGLIDFINIRQKAIEDALANVPHENVHVLQYVEVNRVESAMAGKERVTNKVLPFTTADLVSYSAYDIPNKEENADYNKLNAAMTAALDFIESNLADKTGVPFEKRVFIGEYGYASSWLWSHGDKAGEVQANLTKGLMKVALNWGTPFILYWQMYDNEYDSQNSLYQGFWLIDDSGEKQPAWHLHHNFYNEAKKWVSDFEITHQRPPTPAEFRAQAVDILDRL